MECENLSYSKSRDSKFTSRFGSNFATRHKKAYLLEYQQSLASPFRVSRQSSIDKSTTFQSLKDSDRRQTPPPSSSQVLSHYSSLLSFKQKMSTQLSRLSQDIQPHARKSSFDRLNYDRLGESNEIWEKINLKVLLQAKEIVKKSGVEDVSWTYKRQLRQFCVEVLKVLN